MKKRRILAVLLTAGMIAGSAGCSNQSSENPKETGSNETVAVPEDIWSPYEETVTLSTVLPENVAIRWNEGDDYDDNPWYREWKERFNVQVINDWVSNDYATKLNLTIAEGNLPDVFKVNGDQLRQLQEADLIWDMTEIFESQASERLKGYMEQDPDTFKTGFIDDKLYGIPQLGVGPIDQPGLLWIRRDWKEETGLGDPETMDDVAAMARAMKETHGGYAITETQSLHCMKIMANGWGAYPGIWIEQEDGTIGYGSIQPEMKEVLEIYAGWYQEGLIDPEFTITDPDKMFQKAVSGEVGISPFTNWFVWGVGPGIVSEVGEDGYFDAYKIPTATGEPTRASIKFDNLGYIVVSKKCENPEAVVRLLNFYGYLQDDVEDQEDPKLMDDLFNLGTIPYAFRVLNPQKEYDRYVVISELLETEGTGADVSNLGVDAAKFRKCAAVIDNQDPSAAGEYFIYGSPKCAYGVNKELVDNNLLVRDKVWGMPTETLGRAGSTLDDILDEGFTKIIVGEEPIEYFDTLVENWKNAGGSQATEEVNEAYGK